MRWKNINTPLRTCVIFYAIEWILDSMEKLEAIGIDGTAKGGLSEFIQAPISFIKENARPAIPCSFYG